MNVINDETLNKLSREALESPRLRKNLNMHAELDDPVQRMFNAIEPGTYVRPHRHRIGDRWELFSILRGRAIVLTFNDAGKVIERVELAAEGPNQVLEIPGSTWHGLVAQAPGTILFEVKQGPYTPVPEQDFAAWAPREGEARSEEFLNWFTTAAVGDTPPAL